MRFDLATPSRNLIHVVLGFGREDDFLHTRERCQKNVGIELVLDIVARD